MMSVALFSLVAAVILIDTMDMWKNWPPDKPA
jgi:hypothetical protein